MFLNISWMRAQLAAAVHLSISLFFLCHKEFLQGEQQQEYF